MNTININSKQEFIDYLENHPQTADTCPDVPYYKAHNIHHAEFISLTILEISFEEYKNYWLYKHPETNELFIGEWNDGGIATTFTVVKIHRDDILTRQAFMNDWYYHEHYLRRYS
jgi:hypothetical protein